MKKIACVGFHDTGASVIDDLFREFDNVAQGYSNAECRVLHDADGISDLEYHLVENPHRLKTELAIERFLRYANENRREYEKTFGSEWMPLCYKYIESLSKFQYNGWITRCMMERTLVTKFRLLGRKVINRLTPQKWRHPTWYNYFPKEMIFHSAPSEELFLKETLLFTEKLCNLISHNDTTEFVLIDQMTPCDFTNRYLRYVQDLKIIVVDRDPRDLFVDEKYNYKEHFLPTEVDKFCVHYRDIRKHCSYISDENVLYVNYEDMIYKYDEMVEKVLKFVGISKEHHVTPKKYFNPQISINGTKMWKRYPKSLKEVEIIKQTLPDMLHIY